jgi:hypothetical protein
MIVILSLFSLLLFTISPFFALVVLFSNSRWYGTIRQKELYPFEFISQQQQHQPLPLPFPLLRHPLCSSPSKRSPSKCLFRFQIYCLACVKYVLLPLLPPPLPLRRLRHLAAVAAAAVGAVIVRLAL